MHYYRGRGGTRGGYRGGSFRGGPSRAVGLHDVFPRRFILSTAFDNPATDAAQHHGDCKERKASHGPPFIREPTQQRRCAGRGREGHAGCHYSCSHSRGCTGRSVSGSVNGESPQPRAYSGCLQSLNQVFRTYARGRGGRAEVGIASAGNAHWDLPRDAGCHGGGSGDGSSPEALRGISKRGRFCGVHPQLAHSLNDGGKGKGG